MTRESPATERVLVGLCHDLNDRLAALQGLLHLAAQEGAIEGDAAAQLRHELERMELLVSRARQLAREPSWLDEALIVPELLDEVRRLLVHHADRSGRGVRLSVPSYLPPVRTDRAALRTLLLHCAALTPDTEETAIVCRHEGDSVRIGFPLAQLPSAAFAAALALEAQHVSARLHVDEAAPTLELELPALRAGG